MNWTYDAIESLQDSCINMQSATELVADVAPDAQAELDAIVVLLQAAVVLLNEAKTLLDDGDQAGANAKVKEALKKMEEAAKRLAALN